MQDDLDRELDTHLELAAEEALDAGLAPNEAVDAARRALGSRTLIREDVRRLSPWAALDDAWQDARYGLRMLRRHSGFAIAAALTLSLGIGATTAVVSLVNSVLLRPLPYPDAERLVMVWEDVDLPAYRNAQNTPAPGNFGDWRDQNTTFVDLAAIRYASWNVTGAGEPIRVEGEAVSAPFTALLGVNPIIGRPFTADDDQAGAAPVVLISHALWVDRFGATPSIIGSTLRLDEEPYTIVGVMPPDFHFPDEDDQLWVPLGLTPALLANRDSHFLRVVGRLRPGVSIDQATADLDTIARRAAAQYPRTNTGVGTAVVALLDQTVGDVRRPLLVVLGIVSALLLMVCANVGTLLLARASARGTEFAVRAALGANRSRLWRQMVTESILLASAGGAIGLALAWAGVVGLRWLAPSTLPRVGGIGIDRFVAAVNVAVAVAAGIICGTMPALSSSRDVHAVLKDEAHGSASRARMRARSVLVVVETALAVVVLVGAGLLLRRFVRLTAVPVGFKSQNVLTFRVILRGPRYQSEPQRTAFARRLTERLDALPGVISAGAISFLPLTMVGRTSFVSNEGEPPRTPGELRSVDFRAVSPGYFRAMSIPVLAGREVEWSDTSASPPSIVISETMARTFWPGQSALGKRVGLGRPEDHPPWLTVVGVVGDVRQFDLVHAPRPAMYFPASQDQQTGETLRDWTVRTAGDPGSLSSAVRETVWALDSTLAVARVRTMGRVRSTATASQQFTLLLVGLFGAIAVTLAAIGLYGLTAYHVTERTRELGIRAALGAQRGALVRLVLAGGARLTVIGVATGTVAAFALSRYMSSLLFGIETTDPWAFAGVVVLIGAVAIVASLIPALRATRVDAIAALRTT
jgi:putative ABC transport system permease protein